MKRLPAIRPIQALCLAVITFCFSSSARAVTPDQVNSAIDKAKAFLLAHESHGNWEEIPSPGNDVESFNGLQYSGLTALAANALLSAGMDENDPRIAPAIAFLEKTPVRGVYAAALRCMLWSRIKLEGESLSAAKRDFMFLRAAMHRGGTNAGTFSYAPDARGAQAAYDKDVSQFAVLGLWSLYSREGFEIPESDWKMIDHVWRAHQCPNGAWANLDSQGADPNQQSSGATAGGIATLFITDQRLRSGLDCAPPPSDANIASGIDWLTWHSDTTFDLPHEQNRHQEVVSLFAIARVGAAGGYQHFGDVDWYQRCADYICQAQQPDGSWTAYFGPIAASSMGIMGLSYATAPVVLEKLQSEDDLAWNLCPLDLCNFTQWMGKDLQDQFNYQVMNLQASSFNDLHDAPVLYISGNRELHFSREDKTKLRKFVLSGGLILGNADCGSDLFAASFEQLGKDLFSSYDFRTLPVDHLIFLNEQNRAGAEAKKVSVRGLSNGVRELMLLPKADLSEAFEGRMEKAHPELFRLTEDIILYAVGNARPPQKGVTYLVQREKKFIINKRVDIAYLQYAGNWNPEPGGWWRLTEDLYNHNETETAADYVVLGTDPLVTPANPSTQPAVGDSAQAAVKKKFDLARLTGTDALHLDDQQRQELKRFVDAGGILFIDAAGGSREFADSAEAELKIIFGDEANQLEQPLPPSDELFSAGGKRIDTFQYRRFAQTKLGAINLPQLRAIRRNGRLVVLFSREDISQGLVGNPVNGIIGYEPQTATEIVKRIMIYAAHSERAKSSDW